MCGGDLHLCVQEILETSVRFYGDTKNPNLQTVLASQNNQLYLYYQRYNVKRLRAFHKQAMTKQQIYDNILARRSGVDYSTGIKFQTSLINMEEAKELTMRNQPEKNKKAGAGVAPSSTY